MRATRGAAGRGDEGVRGTLRAVAMLVVLWASSCAGPRSEQNLAPLFSRFSPAGGGVATESLGGFILTNRPAQKAPLDYYAIRPLYSRRIKENGDEFHWFLPPFGTYDKKPRESVFEFRGVFRKTWKLDEGDRESWTLLTLPGIYWAKSPDGKIKRAWLPIGGVVEDFFSYDRVTFVLWPLFMKTKRNGRTTWHFPFPILSFSSGEGGRSWRFWPLVGRNKWEGRYDRWFFLWPIFHLQKNDRDQAEREESAFGVMPLFGAKKRGSRRSFAFLWPFFGYGRDRESGAWALDAPWPFVRFLGPGDEPGPTRRRVWPFYSYYKGDGLTSHWVLWPLFNKTHEKTARVEREATRFFPFYRSWTRDERGVGRSTYRKVWPLVRTETGPDSSYLGVIALNPFQKFKFVDEHYKWLYELYARERHEDRIRERSWLGLYRRERDKDEDRRSFSVFWARRDYSQRGQRVTETSFLFGLLRFRKVEGEGIDWLRPALPGPGWPLDRVPNSIHDQPAAAD